MQPIEQERPFGSKYWALADSGEGGMAQVVIDEPRSTPKARECTVPNVLEYGAKRLTPERT